MADEAAFWSANLDSSSPDVEVITAVRPGLSTIPYSLLLIASSPYAKRGVLYSNFAVRPEGADHQWRKIPPRELSIALVAGERFGRATGWIEAS